MTTPPCPVTLQSKCRSATIEYDVPTALRRKAGCLEKRLFARVPDREPRRDLRSVTVAKLTNPRAAKGG